MYKKYTTKDIFMQVVPIRLMCSMSVRPSPILFLFCSLTLATSEIVVTQSVHLSIRPSTFWFVDYNSNKPPPNAFKHDREIDQL